MTIYDVERVNQNLVHANWPAYPLKVTLPQESLPSHGQTLLYTPPFIDRDSLSLFTLSERCAVYRIDIDIGSVGVPGLQWSEPVKVLNEQAGVMGSSADPLESQRMTEADLSLAYDCEYDHS